MISVYNFPNFLRINGHAYRRLSPRYRNDNIGYYQNEKNHFAVHVQYTGPVNYGGEYCVFYNENNDLPNVKFLNGTICEIITAKEYLNENAEYLPLEAFDTISNMANMEVNKDDYVNVHQTDSHINSKSTVVYQTDEFLI